MGGREREGMERGGGGGGGSAECHVGWDGSGSKSEMNKMLQMA